MFKVLISDSVFNRIKTAEEQRTSAGHSNLYKLLNQQPERLRPGYGIMVEVFGITDKCTLYDDSHDRQIVSNYFIVEASHKLAAFNPEDKGTVNGERMKRCMGVRNRLFK